MLINVEIEKPLIKSFLFLKKEKIKRGKGANNNIPRIIETKSFVIKKLILYNDSANSFFPCVSFSIIRFTTIKKTIIEIMWINGILISNLFILFGFQLLPTVSTMSSCVG